jgi:hypothetical protein
MKYCSIDIETTDLATRNEITNQLDGDIVEFGCVIDDLADPKPIEDLPTFHCYFTKDQYTGRAFPLSMHKEIFERIAKREEGYNYYSAMNFGWHFSEFLKSNGYEQEASSGGGKPKKIYLNVAGKNFGSFDLPYLEEKSDISKFVKIRHRMLDVGPMYMEIGDEAVPGLVECLDRAGIDGPTSYHTAVGDSIDVIKLIRHKMLG